MFVFPASAASVQYSVTSASGQKGDTVTVTVKMSSGVAIWGANVKLAYNTSELQYVSCAKGGAVSGGSLHHNSSDVTFSGMYGSKSGTVFTVKFKILKASGSSKLTLSTSENIDSNGKTYSASVSGGTVTVSVPVTGIKLNKSSVTLKKGGTSQLTATVSPDNATNKKVTYSTSNSKVAKVSSSGVITAVGGGTATITAKAGGKTATCKVTVNVAQTGIALSGNASKEVELGSTLKLKVIKVPSDATDSYTTAWTSADTGIATVSSNGTVTGVKLGTTKITAKQNGWTVTYNITVVEKTEESSATEPSTEESSTEESTSETTSATTELTTENVTEPTTKAGFFQSIIDDINDENNKVTKLYHYAVTLLVAVVVTGIASTVTFFVTSSYYKAKIKKNNREDE